MCFPGTFCRYFDVRTFYHLLSVNPNCIDFRHLQRNAKMWYSNKAKFSLKANLQTPKISTHFHQFLGIWIKHYLRRQLKGRGTCFTRDLICINLYIYTAQILCICKRKKLRTTTDLKYSFTSAQQLNDMPHREFNVTTVRHMEEVITYVMWRGEWRQIQSPVVNNCFLSSNKRGIRQWLHVSLRRTHTNTPRWLYIVE